MTNPLLERYPHPGKFEGELNLAEKLWELSLEMGQDEDLGECDGFGYYCLFTALDNGDLGDLDGITAAILWESDSGFVYATYYNSNSEAKDAWTKLEAEYETYLSETEVDEDA